MAGSPDFTRVVDPDGVQWRVTRTWTTWSPREAWRKSRSRGASVLHATDGWSDSFAALDSTDLWGGLAIIGGILALALIVIPILLFGLELIIVGLVLAAGLIARIALGRPWTIEARTTNTETPRVLEWQVAGWRRSDRVVREIAADITAGREPRGSLRR